jgi:Contact-dependent growth inhibition CdiA C-terminal domain
VPADRPGYLDGPERQPGAELARRLDRLPPGHPSSPEYWDGGDKPPPERDPAGQRVPAARRPEWQEPLAQGTVERIGSGVVDERASQFSPRERRIAEVLAGEGRAVVAVHDGYGADGRRPDAAVDGTGTEFKSLDPGASDKTVKAALTSAKGQAGRAVVDGRDSGLSRDEAEQGLRRFLGTPYADRLEAIRILGDDYDLNWKRGQ